MDIWDCWITQRHNGAGKLGPNIYFAYSTWRCGYIVPFALNVHLKKTTGKINILIFCLTDAQCQLCNHLIEDYIHLLHCKHKMMQEAQHDLVLLSQQELMTHGNQQLAQIIQSSILHSSKDKLWSPNINDTTTDLHWALQDQGNIGWNHFFYGRIASSMITFMESHFREAHLPQQKFTGKR